MISIKTYLVQIWKAIKNKFVLHCPKCGGKMHLSTVHVTDYFSTIEVYECEQCGQEWF